MNLGNKNKKRGDGKGAKGHFPQRKGEGWKQRLKTKKKRKKQVQEGN